jgi:glucose-1-phosphate thymidylyltransferase
VNALILAAGYATRLYPLTQNFPKPLLTVGKKTIMDHLIDRMAALPNMRSVYIVTNAKFSPVFSDWAIECSRRQLWPHLSLEVINDGTDTNENRLGAIADMAYAIQNKNIGDDLLVSAGDNIYLFDFNEMADLFHEKQADVILTYRIESLEKLRRSGVVELDDEQRIIGFEEKPAQPKSNYGCPALYFFKKSSLATIPDYLRCGGNPDAPGHFIAWLREQHPVYAYIMTAPYYDIGTLESYQQVNKVFAQ